MAAPTTGPPVFPHGPALVLPALLFALLIATRARRSIRLAYIIAHVAFHVHTCLAIRRGDYTTRAPADKYTAGATISLLMFSEIVLLWSLDGATDGIKQILDEVRHEEDAANPTKPAERGFWARLWWALCLVISVRNVGWSIEVKNTPKMDRVSSKAAFMLKTVFQAAKLFLILDLTSWYLQDALFVHAGAIPIRTMPLPRRALMVYAMGANAYSGIYMYYMVPKLVFVGLGLSKPERWPDLFGRWRDSYTVRRFWGMVWHQLLRRFIGPISSAATKLLSLRKGTRLSSNVQLFIGFALSAACHYPGDVAIGISLTRPSALFFLVQPFAIMFEDWLIELVNGGRNMPCRLQGVPLVAAKVLGYVWVFAWFVWSVPLLVDPQLKVKLYERTVSAKWSVVERLIGLVESRAVTTTRLLDMDTLRHVP